MTERLIAAFLMLGFVFAAAKMIDVVAWVYTLGGV
jgi:hypothetical protein